MYLHPRSHQLHSRRPGCGLFLDLPVLVPGLYLPLWHALHVFFIEGYWHYVFGEEVDYSLPYSQYEHIPLLPAPHAAAVRDGKLSASASAQLAFPPLRLTRVRWSLPGESL